MADQAVRSTRDHEPPRVAGIAAIAGALLMVVGAGLYFSSGADLWAALADDAMQDYLGAAGDAKAQLAANLSFWIVGVLTMGYALHRMADQTSGRTAAVRAARHCVHVAVPLAILAFITMMALVLRIAPDTSPASLAVADTLGWVAARADDLATSLLVGFAPFFLARAARGDWMPQWLAVWGYVAGAVGLFSLVVLYVPPIAAAGFLIVPVGVGWMVAVGIVLLRQ